MDDALGAALPAAAKKAAAKQAAAKKTALKQDAAKQAAAKKAAAKEGSKTGKGVEGEVSKLKKAPKPKLARSAVASAKEKIMSDSQPGKSESPIFTL